MSIRARKLKSGKTVYDVTLEYGTRDGRRDRKVKTYQTRKEAEIADSEASRLRYAMRNKSGRITLNEYIDRYYWPIALRRLGANTLDSYKSKIDVYIKPILGKVYLDDIDRMKIQTMIDRCNTKSSAKSVFAVLKIILNEAASDGFISTLPKARYAFPPEGKKRDNGIILTDFEQIASFIAVVQNDAPEAITRLVMTGLMLGLRPEERYALDYEDFDFQNGTVEIKSAYISASKEHGGNQIKEPKTRLSHRVIPMPKPFIDWFYWTDNGSGAWITNRNGNRILPCTARSMWREYLRKHPDLPPVTLENMRHSFATACLNAGMHVEDLSRMLGHSNITTTYNKYVKPDIKNIREGLSVIPYPE